MSESNPKPAQIVALREAVQAHYRLGIMAAQERCALAVHAAPRTWAQWESGKRGMPGGLWELALLRCNAHPQWRLVVKG